MGLDMYLKKCPKVYKDGKRIDLPNLDPDELRDENPELYLYLKPFEKIVGEHYKWQSYSVEIGYWRKANQIHNWFVECVQDGVDECRPSLVSKEQLIALLDVCRLVKGSCHLVPGTIKNGYTMVANGVNPIYEHGMVIQDPFMAQTCLPTTSGFFFGSEEYDQFYVQDIDHTIEVLERALAETDFNTEDVFYRSSW